MDEYLDEVRGRVRTLTGNCYMFKKGDVILIQKFNHQYNDMKIENNIVKRVININTVEVFESKGLMYFCYFCYYGLKFKILEFINN